MVLIYLSRQPLYTYIHTYIYIYIYIHTHVFFIIYTHTYLFDKLYIYTHPTKKKNLVFSIKIIFDSDFS